MNIAIITGASSGLGREFALQICQNYASEIDEIWLLARRKESLLALAQEISATGICVGAAMPMDITDDEQMKDFQDKLDIEAPTVKYLVNAAGLAKIGGPFTLQPEELTHMIDLNCKAAVHMTAICMPHFDKGSRILQICSTAGFQPMQGLNVYAASKAFLPLQSGASLGIDRKTDLCDSRLPILDQRYRIYRCCKRYRQSKSSPCRTPFSTGFQDKICGTSCFAG